jgi:hypothetical protein
MPASPTSRGRRASASVPPVWNWLARMAPRVRANGLRPRMSQRGRVDPQERMGQPRQADRAGSNFGVLEHRRETRFGVPKITFIVISPFSKRLKNQADSHAPCSKNARIRASWAKFQKSTAIVGCDAIQPPMDTDRRRSLSPWQILVILSNTPGFVRRCQVVSPPWYRPGIQQEITESAEIA